MILISDYNGNFNPKTQDLACIIFVVYIRYDAQGTEHIFHQYPALSQKNYNIGLELKGRYNGTPSDLLNSINVNETTFNCKYNNQARGCLYPRLCLVNQLFDRYTIDKLRDLYL